MKRVLITGANGFVGSSLCQHLRDKNYQVTAVVQQPSAAIPAEIPQIVIDNLDQDTDWSLALNKVEVVVHLAARVHIMRDTESDPLKVFRRINVLSTKKLAEQAVAAGVKRFVFISSLHVNGCKSVAPLLETDAVSPETPYAISKWEAEQQLRQLADTTGLEVVIVRPPLIYGPQVRANFLRLLRLANSGIPLPLAAINNKRSLVSLANMVDFLICCIEHPKAANELLFVSDDHDLAIGELIGLLAKFLGRQPRLFSLSPKLLYFLSRVLRKQDTVERLCGSLQVNISKAKDLLNWSPVQPLEAGLKEVANWYKTHYG